MTSALQTQIGGSHYKKHGIQPVEFAMKNRWDFCAGSILKYLTRWRDKAGVVDLQKARHFVELREATLDVPSDVVRARAVYTMREYVERNGIPTSDAHVLFALEDYVMWGGDDRREIVLGEIDRLISLTA